MNFQQMTLRALAFFGALSLSAQASIPFEIQKLVPGRVDIDSPEYQYSKAELEQLIKDCGPGIVAGAVDTRGDALENRCSFQIELDDLFFEGPETKTGYIQQKGWAYQDGVEWFMPNVKDVPEKFDLRDQMKNGIPEIKKQQCSDCWAWSTHHGLEIARAVHDQKVVDHSIQTVLSCSKAGSCSGGYMRAVDFLLHGLPEEAVFPYAAYDKSCKFNSTDISTGWEPKMLSTPYVGDSKRYSLAKLTKDGSYREGVKVREMMSAMTSSNSPLVVTVAAYSISGNGIYNSCSAINSGGNHMVAVVGWDSENGKRNAHVWNSWGKSHGENGVSRIQWECGEGKLNRGLGVSAKVVQYKPACVPPKAGQTYLHEIKKGESVQIGVESKSGIRCRWTPAAGLSDPSSCSPIAQPTQSTEYHLTTINQCGRVSSMTLVDLGNYSKTGKQKILTPHGEIIIQK
jgi:KDEL-tailed cysteine endopeptidase